MHRKSLAANLAAVALGSALALLLAACGKPAPSGSGSGSDSSAGNSTGSHSGAMQTRFPGDTTSGGGTSGEVMARANAIGGATREAGTPGIPQGSGGNTGGAALGGTTGNGSIGGTGRKTPAQAASDVPAERPAASAPASPASR